MDARTPHTASGASRANGSIAEPQSLHADQPRLRAETIDQLLRLGGAGLLAQLIELFASSTPERIERIRAGRADAAAAESAAHTLKSSAGNVGAMRMWALCNDLEAEASVGHCGARYDELAAELEREYAIVEPRLRAQLEKAS